MTVDEKTIEKLIENVQDRADCQIKESISKYIMKMLDKNREAKLTINFNFALDGTDILVKGDATTSSQEKHKDDLLEIVVNDHPDLFDQAEANQQQEQPEPLQLEAGDIQDVEPIEDEEGAVVPDYPDLLEEPEEY